MQVRRVIGIRQNGSTEFICGEGGKLLITSGVLVNSINTVVSIYGNKGSRSVKLTSDRQPVPNLGLRKFTNFYLVNHSLSTAHFIYSGYFILM
jgi:hypothetical protein